MQLHWPTAAVVIAMLASVVVVALIGTPTVGVAAAGVLGTLVAGIMRSMLASRDDGAPPADRDPHIPPPPSGPTGLARVAIASAILTACGNSLPTPEETAGADVSAVLKKCRTEARAEYYVGQKSVEVSLAAYDACKRDAGLP